MKRFLAAAIGTLGCAAAVVACSSGGHTASPGSSTAPSVATGSAAQVKVGGTDLPGVDPASVTCVKTGGKINIGSGSAGGRQALAVVMTDEATPKVESLALVVDGNALSVANNMGAKVAETHVAQRDLASAPSSSSANAIRRAFSNSPGSDTAAS